MSWLDSYRDKIKGFEGYTPTARPDGAQNSNGYGTRALTPNETIDKSEAERRFGTALTSAASTVNQFAPDAPDGIKAALTSLTFNAGDKWTRSGLGQAVKAGDYDTAKDIFTQYNRSGGEVNDGLVSRRNNEASWFNAPSSPIPQPGVGDTASPSPMPANPVPQPSPTPSPAPAGAFSGILPTLASDPSQSSQAPSGSVLGAIGKAASAFGNKDASAPDTKAALEAMKQNEQANASMLSADQQRAQQALQTIMQKKVRQAPSLTSAFG